MSKLTEASRKAIENISINKKQLEEQTTETPVVAEGKWGYPKKLTKTSETSDMGTTNAARNRKDRKEWRKTLKAKKHKELKSGAVNEVTKQYVVDAMTRGLDPDDDEPDRIGKVYNKLKPAAAKKWGSKKASKMADFASQVAWGERPMNAKYMGEEVVSEATPAEKGTYRADAKGGKPSKQVGRNLKALGTIKGKDGKKFKYNEKGEKEEVKEDSLNELSPPLLDKYSVLAQQSAQRLRRAGKDHKAIARDVYGELADAKSSIGKLSMGVRVAGAYKGDKAMRKEDTDYAADVVAAILKNNPSEIVAAFDNAVAHKINDRIEDEKPIIADSAIVGRENGVDHDEVMENDDEVELDLTDEELEELSNMSDEELQELMDLYDAEVETPDAEENNG